MKNQGVVFRVRSGFRSQAFKLKAFVENRCAVDASNMKIVFVYIMGIVLLSCSSGHEERVSNDKSLNLERSKQGYSNEPLESSKASINGHKHNTAHDAQAYIKPGAAVVLANSSVRTLENLDSYTLDFGFVASQTTGVLVISLASSESLAIISPQKERRFDLSQDELQLEVSVQAKSFGRHALTFFMELDGLRRIMSVAVQAGPVEAKDSQKTNSDATAPKIIRMKAQETISTP